MEGQKILDPFTGKDVLEGVEDGVPVAPIINKESLVEIEKLANIEVVFKQCFQDAVAVYTKKIKSGGTSNYIYVPKEFLDHHVTVIVWGKVK